jgi:hypothetical protein
LNAEGPYGEPMSSIFGTPDASCAESYNWHRQ